MTREDLVRRLEAAEKQFIGLQDEIANLKAKFAEMQDETEIPDMPDFEMDEKFYYLNSETDDVEDSYYDGDIGDIDFNMFHTEEYAQEFLCKCKLIAMMLHCKRYCDKEIVTEFSADSSEKWGVWYDHFSEEWIVYCQQTYESTTVYFTTKESAQKCADWLNEHWKEDGNGTD